MPTFDVRCDLEYETTGNADFVFAIEAATDPEQTVASEALVVSPMASRHTWRDPRTGNRLTKVTTRGGPVLVRYIAEVDLCRYRPLGHERELPVHALPTDVLPYIWPSRYCESDALMGLARRLFGHLTPGWSRIETICRWIRTNVQYQVGTSGPTHSARDVLLNGAGVCRDYAHIAIAFCRALNVPARFVTGYTMYDDPPPDFHAIFEVFLEDRWIMVDATQLAPETHFIRIATGLDAADCAFATIFGMVRMVRWSPEVFFHDPLIDASRLVQRDPRVDQLPHRLSLAA
jgi:transglutaminase-like putative cysteine protease